jgi:plasmid stabilization system protein ParE
MIFTFHPLAKIELNDAAVYYDDQQKGLGLDFIEEIYATIKRILQFPKAWSKLSKNTFRCLVNRYPYGIIYQVKKNEIRIIAIMHLNRKPGYWQRRI